MSGKNAMGQRLRMMVRGCLALGMVVGILFAGGTTATLADESSGASVPEETLPAHVPENTPAASASAADLTSYKGAYFSFGYDSRNWTLTEGEGYAQLMGKGTFASCGVRIYGIALRAAGGKYRDLEHAVDDGIFQIRDEFGGRVGKKSDYVFKGAEGTEIQGRQFTGEMDRGKVWWLVIPHPVEGVVVAVNIIAPKNFKAGKTALEALLKTLRLTIPPA